MQIKLSRRTIIIISIVLIVIIVAVIFFCKYIRDNISTGGHKINKFLAKYSNDPAVLDSKDFPWSKKFRDNWQDILTEYNNYEAKYLIPSYAEINSDSSGGTVGWKALFLRVFNNDADIIKEFPKTRALLKHCPCTTAYFSMLEPGTHIKEHKGVYEGVRRYHLSLIAPTNWKDCFIVVDGKKLHWGPPGNDIMFNDMYTHSVQNNTNERRMVLFLDIKHDYKNPIINLINTVMLKFIKCNDILITTLDKANKISKRSADSRFESSSYNNSNNKNYQDVNKPKATLSFSELLARTDLKSLNSNPKV